MSLENLSWRERVRIRWLKRRTKRRKALEEMRAQKILENVKRKAHDEVTGDELKTRRINEKGDVVGDHVRITDELNTFRRDVERLWKWVRRRK